jgi:hypothetical protein
MSRVTTIAEAVGLPTDAGAPAAQLVAAMEIAVVAAKRFSVPANERMLDLGLDRLAYIKVV